VTCPAKNVILIVEDETMVRLIGSDVLLDAGYEVLEAATAQEALDILEGAGDVDLLFTDIRMPGALDGLQLAEIVHQRWPAIRILLTSADVRPSAAAIPEHGRFLAKPYRLDTLQREVESVLPVQPAVT
jgi:CheY-like chemotaxis protein